MKYATFKERLADHLRERFGDSVTVSELVEYLYDKGAVDGVQVRKFLVRQSFEVLYTGEPVSATAAVKQVADEFGLSDQYTWDLVRG